MNRARAILIVVPLALLAGALWFQFWRDLPPCVMCWWQRYALIAALPCAVAACVWKQSRWPLLLGGLALAASALIGGYHAGVEYAWWKGFTACSSAVQFGQGTNPLDAIMNAPRIRCDVAPWALFGISLAGYNFLISGVAALAMAWNLRRG